MSTTVSMHDSSIVRDDAWYRHFYVWLIILLPVCAVVASFVTLYIAAQNPPELAVDDYGNIEAIVAQNAAQDREAAAQSLRATLSFGAATAGGSPVEVHLQSAKARPLPDHLLLQVIHSTQAAQDASAELAGNAGHYTGQIRLPNGRYELLLQDSAGHWRLTGRTTGQPARLQLGAPMTRSNTAEQHTAEQN